MIKGKDIRKILCFLLESRVLIITGTDDESIIDELLKRCGNSSAPPEKRNPKAYKPAEAGMMTTEQQSLAWR